MNHQSCPCITRREQHIAVLHWAASGTFGEMRQELKAEGQGPFTGFGFSNRHKNLCKHSCSPAASTIPPFAVQIPLGQQKTANDGLLLLLPPSCSYGAQTAWVMSRKPFFPTCLLFVQKELIVLQNVYTSMAFL